MSASDNSGIDWGKGRNRRGRGNRNEKRLPRSADHKLIRLNPYSSSPDKALKLMGRICSAVPSDLQVKWVDEIRQLFFYRPDKNADGVNRTESELQRHDIMRYFRRNRELFFNKDFAYEVKELLKKLVLVMYQQSELPSRSAVYVALAGTFSTGKSSLLNYLIGFKNLLPENTSPATVVPAYLYCGSDETPLSVMGINNAGAIMQLDADALGCISHSDTGRAKAASQIATSLRRFIVKAPCERFRDFVFIDTPGYDNVQGSDSAKAHDRKVAFEHMMKGEILLWLTNISGGSLSDKDIDIINDLAQRKASAAKGYPDDDPRGKLKVVIVLSKADRKSESGRQQTFEYVCSQVEGMPFVEDVITISTEKNCFKSRSGRSLPTILRDTCNISQRVDMCRFSVDQIHNLFINEIADAERHISVLDAKRKYILKENSDILVREKKRKNEIEEFLRRFENSLPSEVVSEFRTLYQKELSDMDTAITALMEKPENMASSIQKYRNHVNLLRTWRHELENWFDDASCMWLRQDNSDKRAKESPQDSTKGIRIYFCSSGTGWEWPLIHHWGIDSQSVWPGDRMIPRPDIGKDIWMSDLPQDTLGLMFNNDSDQQKSIFFIGSDIKAEHVYGVDKCLGDLAYYMETKMFEKRDIPGPDPSTLPDMFVAIESGDEDTFLRSFSIARDVGMTFNKDGMSPVTYAAHCGNSKALEYFYFEDKDILDMADSRGFTAYHSALAAGRIETAAAIVALDSNLAKTHTADGRKPVDLVDHILLQMFEQLCGQSAE